MKYDYTIYPDNSSDVFLKAVKRLKQNYLILKKKNPSLMWMVL